MHFDLNCKKWVKNWVYHVPATNDNNKNGHELAKSRAVKMLYSQFVTNCPWCKLVRCDKFTALKIVVSTIPSTFYQSWYD